MFGIFGSGANKPKRNFSEIITAIGAGIQDYENGGGNNLSQVVSGFKQADEQARHKQLLAQATQGLTPQQQALAQIDPSAFANRQINNQFQDPLKVQAAKRAQQQQEFSQNRATSQDEYRKQRDLTNDQYRNDRANVADQQFNQQFEHRQSQDGINNAARDRSFDATQQQRGLDNQFRNDQFREQRFQDDRAHGLASQKANDTSLPPALAYRIQQDQEAKASAATAAESQRKIVLDQIGRLREGGDLEKGFGQNFAGSRANPFTLGPGSGRRDAGSVIDQVVSNLTLDKISNFKGAISDKDLEIAQGAATRLNNPNISDAEANRALNELYTAFGGTPPENKTPQGLSAAEAAELEELERLFGGQ